MPPSIRTREASTEDAGRLTDLMAQLGYPATAAELHVRLDQFAGRAMATALVAESEGAVVGLVTCHLFDSIHASAPVAWLTTLIVDASHHGHGIGRALVGAAERWAGVRGAIRISVTSGVQREDAHAFYQRIGYAKSGVRFTKALPTGSAAT